MMTDNELQLLSWRFAAMIGIIDPHPNYSTAEEVEADREEWPELIVITDDGPVFHFDKCAEWIAELSGEPLPRCR